MVDRGEQGGWKGTQGHKLPAIKSTSHRDVTHSAGNMVHNIVMTPYGDRWSLDLSW